MKNGKIKHPREWRIKEWLVIMALLLTVLAGLARTVTPVAVKSAAVWKAPEEIAVIKSEQQESRKERHVMKQYIEVGYRNDRKLFKHFGLEADTVEKGLFDQ